VVFILAFWGLLHAIESQGEETKQANERIDFLCRRGGSGAPGLMHGARGFVERIE
jgi:hypothetical protein